MGLLLLLVIAGCGGESQEATRHSLEVVTDGSELGSFVTELGFEVELDSVEIAIERVEFTVGGEAHEDGVAQKMRRWLVPDALAHPNHSAGGEVAGEVAGPVLLRWRSGEIEVVGDGEFLSGQYAGYNLHLGDGLEGSDVAPGTMARLRGVARRDGEEVAFDLAVDTVDEATIYGGVFGGAIPGDGGQSVALQFMPVDSQSGRTFFDDIDLGKLPVNDQGLAEVRPNTQEYFLLRFALLAHEFYGGALIQGRDQ